MGTILGLILRNIYFQGQHDCMKVVPPVVIKRPSSRRSDWSVNNDPPVFVMYASILFKISKAKKCTRRRNIRLSKLMISMISLRIFSLQSVFEKKLTNKLEPQHAMKQELFVIRNSNIVHDVSKTNDNISTPVQKSYCVPVIVPRDPPVPRGRASDHSHSADSQTITHSSQTEQSS